MIDDNDVSGLNVGISIGGVAVGAHGGDVFSSLREAIDLDGSNDAGVAAHGEYFAWLEVGGAGAGRKDDEGVFFVGGRDGPHGESVLDAKSGHALFFFSFRFFYEDFIIFLFDSLFLDRKDFFLTLEARNFIFLSFDHAFHIF